MEGLPKGRNPEAGQDETPMSPENPIHVGRPNIGDRALFDRLVDGIFERRRFSNNGELVQELERRLCAFLGVRHCVPVCNGTVGLQVAFHALELKGEAVTSPYTFVATPHSLMWSGVTPVFADVNPTTHNLDPEKVEEAIGERTCAIVGVHVWGRPCEIEALDAIGRRNGIPVIYDAAHAFASAHGASRVGNFGACEVFSFHATKFFNTFEGGAVATNDDALAEKIRRMINFGFAGLDSVVDLGTNGKLSEIHAAMGLAGLQRIDHTIRANRERHDFYRERLSGLGGVRFLDYDDVTENNYQYVVIEIGEDSPFGSRDEIHARLSEQGCLARKYFHPGCHRMEPYSTLRPRDRDRFPAADSLCRRVLVLPTGEATDFTDIDRICDIIAVTAGN